MNRELHPNERAMLEEAYHQYLLRTAIHRDSNSLATVTGVNASAEDEGETTVSSD